MTRIQRVCSGVDRPEAVEPDVGRLEVPRGSPRRLGWGHAARDGLDPTPWWYGTDRDHLGRRGQPQIPHGHRRDETPSELGPVTSTISGSPEEPAALDATGVDDERSPLLRWLENYLRGVARGQRVASHPLYLPVPVPTLSYERRVFACASPSSLRPSQLLGSLHNSAYSRSGGPSKTAIPSQRAAKTLHNVDHEVSEDIRSILPRRVR